MRNGVLAIVVLGCFGVAHGQQVASPSQGDSDGKPAVTNSKTEAEQSEEEIELMVLVTPEVVDPLSAALGGLPAQPRVSGYVPLPAQATRTWAQPSETSPSRRR